ncbi:pyridoxamine 5'-phosphate oxidase family protein [Streptomyces sp. 5-10]|uniref:pyridoxamine 5'-phosphate oxidase family protein n=1 Tax=Streptomyces sp. 5-10 TaxID=878925 RepID=UPI00168B4C10|nr:pyridoxamine 5'-phosphate oxidase family protein [Streptomyces sp. 5-10]MBD3007593.1 pyridoxamine 5'-phosphate oxidase family protein [Streptomyces sp. 5-10]
MDLLRTEEIATLAVLDEHGWPSASTMHIAADGLRVYMHTFARTRKRLEMVKDERVSYAVSYLPPGGYDERFETRSLQVKGRAALVVEPDEIALAARLSRDQFPWAASSGMFEHVKGPDEGQQAFFRIDPTEALWADHRVGLMWRTVLDFTPDGTHVARMRAYRDLFTRD